MNKLVIAGMLVAFAAVFSGCRTELSDRFRSNMKTELVPAKFKPKVEVMAEKGVVRGTASASYWFWFFDYGAPDAFAHEYVDGAPQLALNTLEDAAVYDACEKAGASILLMPRFTIVNESSFLAFLGTRTVTVEGVPARIVGAEEIPVDQWPILFGPRSGTQKIIGK